MSTEYPTTYVEKGDELQRMKLEAETQPALLQRT